MRRFVDEACIPCERPGHAHDVEALDIALAELRPVARRMGVYAPQLPAAYGGLELGWRDRSVLLEEAGRSYLAPGAMNCAPPDQPNMINLLRNGTPEQQRRYLLPLAAGERRSCFAMTEPAPGAGSDPSMLRSTAVRRGERWVIDGPQMVHQRCRRRRLRDRAGAEPSEARRSSSSMPTTRAFASFATSRRSAPMRSAVMPRFASSTATWPTTPCLARVGRGFEYAQARLEPARLSHCMRYIGRARRALEIAEAYVLQRRSFGERLAELQQIQAMVADSKIDLHASRLMTWHCAARLDAGESVKDESAMTKVFVSEAVNRVADRAAQMMGALGMSDDTIVANIVRELRPFRIYDGASELHRATLGRRFLRAAEARAPSALSENQTRGDLR